MGDPIREYGLANRRNFVSVETAMKKRYVLYVGDRRNGPKDRERRAVCARESKSEEEEERGGRERMRMGRHTLGTRRHKTIGPEIKPAERMRINLF